MTQGTSWTIIDADTAQPIAQREPEALLHLKSALESGVPWQRAILEAIGLWTLPQEEFQGRTYRYLIQGEAFDWLLLAERLCLEMDGVVPEDEKERLLFYGKLPDDVKLETFRDILGVNKYRAFLNYWYGVVMEEALQLSVEEDVRKRNMARCYADSEDFIEEAFNHLYLGTRTEMLERFQEERGIASDLPLSLSDLKEFTYWLHKYRLSIWDPARVASDTKKGMSRLHLLEQRTGGQGLVDEGAGEPIKPA